MFEKLQVSIWDLLTYVISGVLMIVNLELLTNLKLINLCYTDLFLQPVFIKNEFLVAGYYFALVYLIGAFLEPISNLIFDVLDKVFIKLPWNKKLFERDKNIESSYKNQAKKIIENDYKIIDINIFGFAREYVVQKDVKTNYMAYLSKFGFYRNLSIFPLLDFAIITICEFSWIKLIISFIICLILNQIFYIRSKRFYQYTGTAIYNVFLMHHKKS